jgi:hypothetical protein
MICKKATRLFAYNNNNGPTYIVHKCPNALYNQWRTFSGCILCLIICSQIKLGASNLTILFIYLCSIILSSFQNIFVGFQIFDYELSAQSHDHAKPLFHRGYIQMPTGKSFSNVSILLHRTKDTNCRFHVLSTLIHIHVLCIYYAIYIYVNIYVLLVY